MGQNLSGTWAGTIDRGLRHFFRKKRGRRLFSKKIRGAETFFRKKLGGEDFFRKKLGGEDFFFNLKIKDFIFQNKPF